MKGVFCQGDYLGKFNLITNDSITFVPLSSIDEKLISVKTLSGNDTTLTEYISGQQNDFSILDSLSGYIIFAKQPISFQNFQSETILDKIDFIGSSPSKYTIFRYPFVTSLSISSYNSFIDEVKTTSKDKSILRTYVPSNQINPFEQFEFNNYYLIKVNNNFTINNPDPSITADMQVGSISAGEIVPGGTTLQGFVEQLLKTTFYPTIIDPTLTLQTSLSSIVEVGMYGVTLSAIYNPGSIVGTLIGGIWSNNALQNTRAGEASKYILSGLDNGGDFILEFPVFQVEEGTNTFAATVEYLSGDQPLNNKNQPYLLSLPAGNLSATTSILGKRRAFYGTDLSSADSDGIRLLQNNILNPVKGSVLRINIPLNSIDVCFAYPASLGSVSTVEYIEGLGADVKENFTLTTIAVSGLNDYTPVNYNVYTYAPVEPFSEAVNYIVTI
jgi:hypothetical protein